MSKIHLTEYKETEFQELLKMALDLFKDYPPSVTESDLAAVLRKPNYATFFAKQSGDILGFVTVSIRSDYVEGATTSPVGYLESIYVKPEGRKHGIARQLYEKAESWAAQKGCSEMGSDTWEWNLEAQNFHTKLGFKKEDILVHYIKPIHKK